MGIKIIVRHLKGTNCKEISIKQGNNLMMDDWLDDTGTVEFSEMLFDTIEDLMPRETIVEMLSKYGYEVK